MLGRRLTLQGLAALIAAPSAFAQSGFSFSGKNVKLVVAYAVGGVADITTRLTTTNLATALGASSVVVENRAGANGNIGTEYVARQPADGLTYLIGPSSLLTMNPLVPELRLRSLDVATQLVPVVPLADTTLALVVPATSDVRTIEQFLAKARSTQIRFGNPSGGTPHHLAGLVLERANKLDFIHVPYKGGAPMVADLAGGHIDACFSSISSAEPLVKQGKLRWVAVLHSRGQQSWRSISSVSPWMQDAIIPSWTGIFAPAGTPADAISQMNAAVSTALQTPATASRLEDLGLDPLPMSTAHMQDRLNKESQFMRKFLNQVKLEFNS